MVQRRGHQDRQVQVAPEQGRCHQQERHDGDGCRDVERVCRPDRSRAYRGAIASQVERCHQWILPAQQPDGFWHYGLTGKDDPNRKDILGYFLLTTGALIELQRFTNSYCDAAFQTLDKACAFALADIAPMTDPNVGPACRSHTTPAVPPHYKMAEEPKRGYAVGLVLFGGGNFGEGIKVINCA